MRARRAQNCKKLLPSKCISRHFLNQRDLRERLNSACFHILPRTEEKAAFRASASVTRTRTLLFFLTSPYLVPPPPLSPSVAGHVHHARRPFDPAGRLKGNISCLRRPDKPAGPKMADTERSAHSCSVFRTCFSGDLVTASCIIS